jgi:DNA-binding transcriptional LysR family regulator
VRETRQIRDPRLIITPLYEEELLLAARPEHPFVAEGPIPISRLGDATLIFFDRASDDYELTQSLLKEADVTPYGVIEVDSVDTARRLAARGLGVSFLPSTAAMPEIEAGRLAPVALADAGRIRRRVIAIERAETSAWPPVETLRRLLAEAATFLPGASQG